MSFQIHALPMGEFEHLFNMPDSDLKAIGAMRVTAGSKPGFPCRVSLEDAGIGEELILANYTHLAENSPYKSSHAVYVRHCAKQRSTQPNEIPQMLACRLLSLRGFGCDHLMKQAEVVEGTKLAENLDLLFEDVAINYVHIHYARQGCFAAKATR